MRSSLSVLLGRVAVTAIVIAIAAVVGWQLWVYYMDEPWTRDGRVRADVVGVAPDVSGLVSDVPVRDNQQVHTGDVIFRIDRARFELAVEQADAIVAARRATLDEALREMNRYRNLNSLAVSQEKQQQTEAAAKEAEAAYRQAVADRAVAQLNLDRTAVAAPVNGVVSNFDLRPGDYVSVGKPVAALVDTDTLRVEGYFEETKLPRIRIGDPVAVHLMGDRAALHGHVESIAGGIEDRERSAGSLLPNINPTFSWVRLAQRVPVRVVLDDVPPGVRLIAGRTATVAVLPAGGGAGKSVAGR
ncbi:MAG TPA: HlyD family secretion protein [Stellaceae bacterium]|jgi:RND family efflux transporter MFP subunit